MIKSGKVSDFLSRKNDPEVRFFLSSQVIVNEPSTKERNPSKRDKVLAIEIEQLRKKVDFSKFPLAHIKKKNM
jgi:hypothetical protein